MLSRMVKIILIIFVLGLVFSGSILAENQGAERIFRVLRGWPVHIDPAVGSDINSNMVYVNLYDGLVFPSLDGIPQPHVAKSWNVSDDGLTWTFYLRPGIKFHDGRELTAEDVKFSMDRMIAIGEGMAYLFYGRIDETEVIDKYTVAFRLDYPFAPFAGALFRFFIVNKDLVLENVESGKYGEFGDYGQEFLNLNGAGSGPYQMKEYNYATHITLKQNTDYWLPLDPNCPDEWTYKGGLESFTAKTLLQTRGIEAVGEELPPESLAVIDKIEGVSIGIVDNWGEMIYGMLHNKKAPTDCIHIRKALAWATDYDTITKVIFPGFVQARGPIASGIPGHDPTVFQYYYDLDKAREEVKKSKYYGELDKYPISLHWTAEVADYEKLGLLLQADMKKIGITIKLVKTPWVSIVEQCGSLETSPNYTIISSVPCYSEAGSVLEARYTSGTVRSWEQNEWLQDPELDKRIIDSTKIQDRDERFKAYGELQHYLVDLCPSIFIMNRVLHHPFQEYYMDYPLSDGRAGFPVSGYSECGRFIRIYPEKRLELLK